MSDIAVRPAEKADLADVRALCRAYRALLVERSQHVPSFITTYYSEESFEALLADLPHIHARPDGAIFLAELAGRPVGCAMTQRIDRETSEIKRVFVTPEARGSGAGRALFAAAMAQARADGYGRMVLDTFHTLDEAIGLYHALGFTPAAPFYAPDPALAPFLRFYEARLSVD